MTALPVNIPAPAEDLAPLCHGQAVARSCRNGEDRVASQSLHLLGDEAVLLVTVTEISTVADAPGVDLACSRNSDVEPETGRNTCDADACQRLQQRGCWHNRIIHIQLAMTYAPGIPSSVPQLMSRPPSATKKELWVKAATGAHAS